MAVEVGVSVAAKLAEYLVDPTLQQLQYLFCVGKITRNVEITKEELILKQGRVQERVQEAINRTERIDDEVTRWKNDVKSLIAEVENLEDQLRANNGCLRGWCPTWRRFSLCRTLAKKTQRMIDLNIKSAQLEPFSHHVTVPDIEYHSAKDFMLFESTKRAHDGLLAALRDDDSSMIGLWGMGGSGKTTLVKQVGKKAKDLKLFDRVIITTVSQTPNIEKIQGEIADLLGLKLEEESEVGRARRISMKLQSRAERILIILDDVWAMLNLEDIGNPFGDEGPRNCKVVLTTRRQGVCTLMDCQKTIPLLLLTEDEAWNLFQFHAKVDDGAREVTQEVVMECKGLPIAIVAVGKCLKGKGLDEVKVALHKLRHSKPVEVDEGEIDAYTCLKLSYDYLRTKEAQLLFLMCAMFPEDHEIVVEDLFRYGVGLGLCKDADSFEIARSQVIAAIEILIDSSLLMYCVNFHKEKCVKMHDMVRDVALWIAPEDHGTIMVNPAKLLNELLKDEAIKDCYALSSWNKKNELLQFPSRLDAPKLEFLLLHSDESMDISNASFEGTERLKALIIRYTNWKRIELQPKSIQYLSNLRTLRLQKWDLRDISFVVSLTRLEILDLQGSKFESVPNGIEKLNKLKLLDLSNCPIDECCYKVIGKCSQLEELYVPIHFPHSRTNCYEYLMGPTALIRLRRYKLEIGKHGGGMGFENKDGPRSLHLGKLNISNFGASIKNLARKATLIEFYGLGGGFTSFMANIVQPVGGMNELTKLRLERCSKIECIIDETSPHEDAVMPMLDELELRDMDNLKQLHRGPSPFSLLLKLERLSIFNCPQLLHLFPTDCNFSNLKFIKISDCPMLTSLFPVSIACTLHSLEELKIKSCSGLKHLFGEKSGEEQPMHDQDMTQIELPLLKCLKLKNLPNLVRICSKRYHPRCPSIKTIQWWDCPNMELQELKGLLLRNEEYAPLKAIETIQLDNCGVESICHYQIGLEEQIPTFQYLKEIALKNCTRLKFVFSAQICQSLPELTSVTICHCEELEAIFLENDETDQKDLSINESCLPKLKSLEISKCNKLKFILSFMMMSGATSILPQLSTLIVSNSSEIEEIFKCSNIEDQDIDNEREITFPNVKYVELKNLPILVNVCEGFKLQIGEFCKVDIDECPKLMPIQCAIVDWTKERLVRMYVLKYSQLYNNEALNLPFSVLNAGELDTQSPRVEHMWGVIGDDEEEESNDSEIMLRSKKQMVGGVIPTQVLSFQYLGTLDVSDNKMLKFLFSMRTIVDNSLPNLTSLTISNCEELEVIFGDGSEDDANYGETIVRSSLREIELINLPNLKSVCDQGLQVQVELSDISISNCPKFVDSSIRSALQQLGTISVSTEDSNVQTSSKGLMLISRAKRLYLEDSMNLIYLWEGPTFIIFQNLRKLHVVRCTKMKCMFPSTVIRSLPCLGYLRIEECKELEEMMSSSSSEEHHFPNESSNSLCFPQLVYLTVERCGKLKCIFPSLPSSQLHLPRLKSLWIKECTQLEGLCNREDEIHEEGFYCNFILPNLRYLTVEDCPNFSKTTLAAIKMTKRSFPQPNPPRECDYDEDIQCVIM